MKGLQSFVAHLKLLLTRIAQSSCALVGLSALICDLNGQSAEAAKSQAELQQANPYPPSPIISSVSFDIIHLQRAAPGSDLWPVT